MSITLGIYDLFSYLIPGMFYLYVFNEILRSVGLNHFQISVGIQQSQSLSIILLVPILLGAFVIGHILDPISQRFFNFLYRISGRLTYPRRSLQEINERHPILNVRFQPKDWDILLSIIRQRNIEMARILDKFQADSKMLRNIAFGLIFLSLTQITIFFSTKDFANLLNALGEITLFYFAISKSNQFYLWFFSDIFKASLEYGSDLVEVIEYTTKKKGAKEKIGRVNAQKKSLSKKDS